jgi:ABC-type antimicrobial peptide transport system permease subunit
LVFREGFKTVAAGLTLGLCVAAPLMYALRSILIGFDSRNTAYVSIAAALVTVTAGIACWVPARRATKIDPMSALRQE